MPIEFRCNRCQRLLRTADDTVGKQTKCPECGSLLTIPDPALAAAPPPPAAPPSVNPYLSPSLSPMGSPIGQGPGAMGPGQLDVGDVLGTTWKIFTDKLVAMLVGMLLMIVISLVGTIPLVIVGAIGMAVVGSLADDGNEPAAIVVGIGLFSVWMVAILAFSFWLYGGVGNALLKIARGQTAEIGDLFSGGKSLGALVGAGLLFTLIYLVGILLCVVPGIFAAIVFSQFLWLIIDRKVGAVESLSMSRDITRGNRLNLLLLFLVMMGISMVSGFVPGAGLFTTPFFYLMGVVTYLRLTGQPTAADFPPLSPFGAAAQPMAR